MSALHSVAQAQLGPACLLKRSWALPVVATTSKTSTWPQVCVGNDMMKACMQETESVMSALHSVAQAQLGPACRSDHEQDQHLAASVCVWNAAGRKKKVLKHAKIKHAETRGKKKHAGR